ncbi:MAG: hypothetical protein WDN30_14135 [Pararobbsia sp.]
MGRCRRKPGVPEARSAGQQQTADAYFQKWIAPNTPPSQLAQTQAEWATKSAAVIAAARPSTLQKITNGIASAAQSVENAVGSATSASAGLSPDGQIVDPSLANPSLGRSRRGPGAAIRPDCSVARGAAGAPASVQCV